MASSRATGDTVLPGVAPASVKICGIRTVDHALVAVAAGAELIGMIFAPARRQVSIQTARAITDAVHAARPEVRLVGVFVDAPTREVNQTAMAAGLDLVQLNGDETPADVADIDVGVIKAIRPVPGEDAERLAERIGRFQAAPVAPVAVLIDGYDPHAHGGTGVRADWDLVADVADRIGQPVGLAGGLTPVNLGRAIATARPLFVDTSSGVERAGVKDAALIRTFVETADGSFETAPDAG